MSSQPAGKEFTGRHMALVLVGGFGIVAAVNFYMASLATGGFHGVVVENSYVASQKFNTWLEEAEKSRALGWTAEPTRDADGRVIVTTEGVPPGAVLSAELRRPIGERDYASLAFVPQSDSSYASTTVVADGRWTIRLSIDAEGQSWIEEHELP